LKHRTILLDCDGVLADFLSTVLREANVFTSPLAITDWNLKKCLTVDEYDRVVDLLTHSNIAATMDVMKGAREAVDEFRRRGFGVVVLTSPWISNQTWEHQRRSWLKKHFEVKSSEVISTSAKHLVDGAVLVDDKVEHVEQWTEHRGRPAVLFKHTFNNNTKGPFITGWSMDDVQLVCELARVAVGGAA
jgi:5'(3')-deoxyribonucleotidase